MRLALVSISLTLLAFGQPMFAQDTVPDTPSETIVSPAQTVTDVVITGNTVVPTEDIRSVTSVRAGQPFDRERYQQDADAIEKLYLDRGFQAVVAPSPAIENGVVRFPIVEAVVESIGTRGLRKTKRSAVMRFIQVQPGELYRRERVQADIRELYNLGIFRDITYRLEPGTELGKVEVVYVVEERRTGLVAAGLSYSGNSGIVGQLEVVEANLAGSANAIGGFVQLGGKDYRSGFQVNFRNPIIDRNRTSFDIGVYAKTIFRFTGNDFYDDSFDDEDAYDEFRSGGDFSFSRRIGRNTHAALGFRGNGVNSEYLYLVPVDLDTDGTLEGFYVGGNPGVRDGSVYAATAALAVDRRDNPLDPSRGGVQVLSVELGQARQDGGRFLTGYSVSDVDGVPVSTPTYTEVGDDSGTMSRVGLDIRRYFSGGRPAGKPDKRVPVVALRLVAGTVDGTVPFWEQFFMGGIGIGGTRYARFISADPSYEDPFVQGSQPLRGYQEGRFWGRQMLLASAEYRIPFGENVRGVIFVDAGDAWNSTVDVLDPYDDDPNLPDDNFELHSSIGVGIRVATPFGPARVDFGVGSEGSRTHFSIGTIF